MMLTGTQNIMKILNFHTPTSVNSQFIHQKENPDLDIPDPDLSKFSIYKEGKVGNEQREGLAPKK